MTPVALPALSAQDTAAWFHERLSLSVSGYFPAVDTTVRLDAADGQIGTVIDLEDDLGLADRKALPAVDAILRLGSSRRHRLEFSYFALDRSGVRRLDATIRIRDEVFNVGAQLDSFLDTDVFRAGYGYSFLHDEKKELGINVGLHLLDARTGYRGIAGISGGGAGAGTSAEVSIETSATAPLPNLGFHGAWAFTPRLALAGRGQFFFLDVGDYSGSLANISAALQHRTFRNLGFAIGYEVFLLDLNSDKDGINGNLNYTFHGPKLDATLRF